MKSTSMLFILSCCVLLILCIFTPAAPAALTDNLVSYWKLDGNSNDTVGDPGIFDDDFESYPTGSLNGQGGWSGNNSFFQVQTSVKHSGNNAIACNADNYYVGRVGQAMTVQCQVSLFIRTAVNGGGLLFITNSTGGGIEIVFAPGGVTYNSGNYNFKTIAASMTVDTWYPLDVQWRASDGKARYQFNNAGWTAWDTIFNPESTRLNQITLGSDATGFVYFDDIAGWSTLPNNAIDTSITYSTSNGKTAQGAGFNGSSSKMVIPDASSLKPTGNFTVAFWAKTNVQDGHFFQTYSQNTYMAGFNCNYDSVGGRVYFQSGRNTGTAKGTDWQNVSAPLPSPGNWHFVAASWDGSYLNLYVDNNSPAQTAWSYAPGYAAANYVRIGCQNTTGTDIDFLSGAMDEVGLWSRALSPSEVLQLYNTGNGNQYPFPTPTPTPTATPSSTPTGTPTISPTPTPYPTYTPYPTTTPYPTYTPCWTTTPYPTYTPPPTHTATPAPTLTATPTISPTPTITPTKAMDPAGEPAAGSGMYSLRQVYDYLTTGTEATTPMSFQEPGAGPGPTMKSLREIYEDIHAVFTQCAGTTAANVESGKPFFSTHPGSWGMQRGTLMVP